MPVYGFDESSAKRIGETVRLVEGSRVRPRSASPGEVGRAAVGVRCMLGSIGTASWAKSSEATVTLYSGEPGNEQTVETVTAFNYSSDIPSDETGGGWVVVSNNGYGWLLVDGDDNDNNFRTATNASAWAKDSSATITFTNPRYSSATATAYNYFCSIGGGGDVAVCRDEDGVWNLVEWEMVESCATQIVDVQLYLDETNCNILKTLVTATQRFVVLSYPYTTCS